MRNIKKEYPKNRGGESSPPLNYTATYTIFIGEPGSYQLILNCKFKEAEVFRDWVSFLRCSTITQIQQLKVENEFELYKKVASYIRKLHSKAIILAGLGDKVTRFIP